MELLGDVSHVEYRFFPFGDRYQLGDMGHVESHFILFGGSVSFVARYMHNLRQTYHRL